MDTLFCYLKSCTRCGGDLIYDEGDWRCWQCGHYYYRAESASRELPNGEMDPPAFEGAPDSVTPEERPARRQRTSYGTRATRNINSVIRAKKLSDERWWARNRQVIEYLDRGLSIREISGLTGLGERQIRVVRERLADLRAEADAKWPPSG